MRWIPPGNDGRWRRSRVRMVLHHVMTLSALAATVASCSSQQEQGASRLTLAVIPKGTSHAFWQSVHAGARRAAKEHGVDIVWRGPLREDDRDAQISEVENAIGRGVSGIALAPLDEAALVQPVQNAQRRGIPVVIFDSGLKGDEYVSFVATDNDAGGRLAGEHLATQLAGKGRVILLRYAEGHDSTARREEGFLTALRAHPGIEVVSANQYVGADVEGAYKRIEGLLSQHIGPDRQLRLDGLFAPNESSAFAMLRVLRDNGWAGKVRAIGFDASDGLVNGLSSGDLEALVVQDPVRMGYLSVTTLVAHLKGQRVERRIDTGVRLITRDLMSNADVQQLLKPDLSQ
jgi:ribose transport system substrate-binding protein